MIPNAENTITDVLGRIFTDDLSHFALWWSKQPYAVPLVPSVNAFAFEDNMCAITLFREGAFQVQLIIANPDCIIPPHTHPNVDSYEVFLNGMQFTHTTETVCTFDDALLDNGKGIPNLRGATVRVKPDEMHGGQASSQGGSFLSIQQWLNNITPTSVGNDWDGEVMGEKHKNNIYGMTE